MNYYIVFLLFPNLCFHSVSSVRMPLKDNNLRAPLFIDVDISQMNQELKQYIDNDVKETCYEQIDNVVTDRHTDLKSKVLDDMANTKSQYDLAFSALTQDVKLQLKQLEQKNEELKKKLDEKNDLLSEDLRSKFSQLEQKLMKENEVLKKEVEEKNKEQNAKLKTENDDLITKKYEYLKTDVDTRLKDSNEKLKTDVDTRLKDSNDKLKTDVNTRLKDSNDKLKKEIEKTNTKVMSSQKRVAVTACAKHSKYRKNIPIPFPAIVTSYGMNSLSSLKSNGLFTCEHSGLYIVSVTLMSNQNDGYFSVYKNNDYLVDVYLQGDNSNYHSGTAMVVVDMTVNDKISVKPHYYDNSNVFGDSNYQTSCLTVVKVK